MWGRIRATEDLDVLLELPAERIGPFVAALHDHGLEASVGDFEAALRDSSHVTVFDPSSIFHVDVKLARAREEQDQVARATEVEPTPGRRVGVASAEDTVAFKLSFGSPQDLEDARSILENMAGSLDLGRVRRVAERLGVREGLERLLAETNR